MRRHGDGDMAWRRWLWPLAALSSGYLAAKGCRGSERLGWREWMHMYVRGRNKEQDQEQTRWCYGRMLQGLLGGG